MKEGNPITAKIYSLEPVLGVNDIEESLEYYTTTLGFTIDWTWPNDGKVNHASVSFGEGHAEGDGSDHDEHHIHLQLSQADITPVENSGWLYLRIEGNIDNLHQQFVQRGAVITEKLGDRPWGMREFQVADINGHQFRFAKPIPHDDA